MQILAETEYQDVYRITDGVLLVVNKFKPIDYKSRFGKHIGSLYDAKLSKYNKGCQDCLKVLKKGYHDKHADIKIPKGTVTYYGRPVELVDKSDYEYQIKTTGDSFSGSADEIDNMLSDIFYRIKYGKCRQ